jgi:arachidonate 15-lipoxygenase
VLIGNRELGELQLGGPSGFAATIFSHDHVGVARMATDRLTRYDFWDLEPDTQFARRGTTTTPFSYPYRDNILELWTVTLSYARRYLALYYPDDASIRSDPHLLAWLDDLDGLLPNGLGPRPEPTADWIARICATVIHLSTVEHDFLNNVAWNYSTLGWLVPTVAPLSGERMDQRRAFDLIATLIGTWKPYNMLLSAGIPELALDAEARTVMTNWIADLKDIQSRMAAGAPQLSLSYPANLNVSISN